MTLVRFLVLCSVCLYGECVVLFSFSFFFFLLFRLSRDNEFVRDTGTQFSCSLCFYGECVARACVQCERTSAHQAELVGVVGECVITELCSRPVVFLSS